MNTMPGKKSDRPKKSQAQTRPPKPSKSKVAPDRVIRPAKKTFTVEQFDSAGRGQKVLIYAPSGMGKTTLASLAPDPVFLALDEGLESTEVLDGLGAKYIPQIENFWDVRDALQTPSLFEPYQTIVIDTANMLEVLSHAYMFATIPHEKGGTVKNIEGYGWGKGYTYLVETMRLILSDLEELVRRGKTVAILAQSGTILKANPGGEDFLEDGPGLYHSKSDNSKSVRNQYCEWCDHVVRLGYYDTVVKDKKASGETTRAVFVQPEVHFYAKSRTIQEPVLRFEDQTDDTFWKFLNGEIE